jgi:hypothetical protein
MKKKKSIFDLIEEKILEEKTQIKLRAIGFFIKLSALVLFAYVFIKNIFLSIFAVIFGLFIVYSTFFFFLYLWQDIVFFTNLTSFFYAKRIWKDEK